VSCLARGNFSLPENDETQPEEHRMRLTAVLVALTLVAACARKEEVPVDSPAAAAPAAPTIADFAGTWQIASVLEGTPDTVKSTLTGAPDGTFSMTLEGRPNIPVTVSMSGDSLIGQSAEYESVLRKGVMVTVRTASVMSNGMLMGNLEATYKAPTETQVVKGTFTGTKAP
jgi:hypothetical protein